MRYRPLIEVTYELKLITSDGEVTEVFDISYDSEMYGEDEMESVDSAFVSLKMKEMKEKYGNNILLISYRVERSSQIIH